MFMEKNYKHILVGNVDHNEILFEYSEYLKIIKFAKAGASDGSRGVLLGEEIDGKIYIYKVIELTRPMQIVKLEEAEGDSFNVDITIATINNYYPDYKWEGNGRYAKGDTINVCIEKPLYYEMGSVLYRVPNDSCFSFVVKNDINIVLLQDYPIGVDQVVAEKESDPFVNVYTINGHLLKQHVLRENALDGLNKGLYIVGRKKVFVRR